MPAATEAVWTIPLQVNVRIGMPQFGTATGTVAGSLQLDSEEMWLNNKIWGAGQQQVRNVWSSIGCWLLCGWLYAMVELECWDESMEQLVDRSDRPWDNPLRRPSYQDRRSRIASEMLRESFLSDLQTANNETKIRLRFEQLLALAT